MKTGQRKISDREFLGQVANGHANAKELAKSLGIQEQSVASRAKRLREKLEKEMLGDSPKIKLACQKLRRFEVVSTSERVTVDMIDELFDDVLADE